MNMPLVQKTAPSKRRPKNGTRKSEVLGVTKDGVKILKPARAPTNFTIEEVREAVARVLGKSV
jgi:hypothetical protein